jgi:integral membrane sensor domain MASE1
MSTLEDAPRAVRDAPPGEGSVAIPSGRSAPRLSGPVLLALTALAHAASAILAWVLLGAYEGDPVFWPANGIIVAILVLLGGHRRSWPWVLAGAVLAETITSSVFGLDPWWSLAYAGSNLVEIVIVTVLFLRWAPDRDLSTRRGFAAFTVAGLVIGPAVGALLGATVHRLDAGVSWTQAFFGWWTGDALGLVVVAATIVAWAGPTRSRRASPVEWTLVQGLVAVLAAVPYLTAARRTSSLPIAVLLWAAVRLGVRGTLTGGLVFVLVSEVFTAQGVGLWVEEATTLVSAQVYLRLFLVVALITPWLLAVEVSHREAAELRESSEREARRTAEALAERLARLRAFAEDLSRAATRAELEAAWDSHAASVLDGWGHRLVLVDLDDHARAPGPLGDAEARALATHRPVVDASPVPGNEIVVAAPVSAGDDVVGVVSWRTEATAEDAVDREAVAAVAARLGETVVRIRLYHETLEAGRRLAVLQQVTSRLGRAPTTAAVVDVVLDVVGRTFDAAGTGLLVVDRGGRLGDGGAVGRVPDELAAPQGRFDLAGEHPLAMALTTGEAVYGPPRVRARRVGRGGGTSPAAADEYPWAVLPLVFGDRSRGLLWLAWDVGAGPGPNDRPLHEAVAEQCAAALVRVTASDAEHAAAVELQRALLPTGLPQVPNLATAARYLPSDEILSVGGDWYDMVCRPDGRIVVTVGDVVGHDVSAAAAMGRLRSALSTIATDAAGPAEALERLDRFPDGPDIGFATAVCVEVDAGPRGARLRYASAGHPPLLLVRPTGEARFLMAGRSAPLFVRDLRRRPFGEVTAAAGSVLVGYSDGLIERPRRSLKDGMLALARACLTQRHRPLEEFADRVLEDLTSGDALSDDVVLICLALGVCGDGEPLPQGAAGSGAVGALRNGATSARR